MVILKTLLKLAISKKIQHFNALVKFSPLKSVQSTCVYPVLYIVSTFNEI